jgi:CRP-like cAMP-binding protein
MFFIINEGEVQIEINNTVVKTMKRGDFFGELAFIYSSPRSASVKVLSKCTFWCLSQHLFLKIQREMVKNNFKIAKQYVSKLPIFSFLTPKQKDAICYNMNALKYEESDIVFKAGEDAMSFFIIIEGLIEIDISGKPAIQLKSGDSFGENCIRPNQIRSGTASCVEKTHLLAISREDLKSCLGGKSEE